MRRLTVWRVVVVLATLAAIPLALSGCEKIYTESALRIALRDTGLGIVMCEAVSPTIIYVDEQAVTESAWTTVWQVDGSVDLSAGTVLSVGDEVPGTDMVVARRVNTEPGTLVRIAAIDNSPTGRGADFYTQLPDSAAWRAGGWLHTDGTVTEQPCDGWPPPPEKRP